MIQAKKLLHLPGSPLLLAVLSFACADASVQPVHWYHMGEADPLGSGGRIVTALHDSIGSADLSILNPRFVPGPPCPAAAERAGSTGSIGMSTSTAFAEGPLLGTETDDFGFETWFSANQPSLTQIIAANGTPGVNGWDISLTNSRLTARLGASATLTYPSSGITGWHHAALVRTRGVTTLYLDGQPSTNTSTAAIIPPTGMFHLGATSGTSNSFYGSYDETRYFRTDAGFNPTADLLVNIPRVQITHGGVTIPNGGTLDLGNVPIGGQTYENLEITDSRWFTNPNVALRISSVTLSGPDAGDFHIQNSPRQPAAMVSSFLEFFPTSEGPKSATLTVVSNDPGSPCTITITANVYPAPAISILAGADPDTAPRLADGVVPQTYPLTAPSGEGSEKTFTILNDGFADLHLGTLAILGTNSSDFTITQPPSATTLATGESTTFTVKFKPLAPGNRIGLITIDSDAFNSQRFHVPLAGTATGPQIQLTGPGDVPLPSRTLTAWGWDGIVPGLPADLGPVTALAAGDSFVAALRSDGTVAVSTLYPALLEVPAGLNHVVAISGYDYLLALRSDGTVAAWGNNSRGQCDVPAGLSDVVAISAGYYNALALKSDGSVVAWGLSYNGTSVAPLPQAALSGVTAISAGSQHRLAVKSDGSVIDWDYAGNASYRVAPGLPPMADVASCNDDSFGLTRDGVVLHWSPYFSGFESVFPATASPFVSIAGHGTRLCAVRADGTFETWSNLGDDIEHPQPADLTHVLALSPSDGMVVALSDSRVDFGAVDIAHPGAAKTFTVTNSGSALLHLSDIALTGSGASGFTLDTSGLATTLAAGETTSFTIAFTPGNAGTAEAGLRILSDASGHPVFTADLSGVAFTVATPLDAWKLQHFATTSNTGDSADDADPNHNGIPNLLEYALGGDPAGNTTDIGILPKYAIDSRSGNLTFDRLSAHSDITLTLQASETLDTDDWIDVARSTSGAPFTVLVPDAGISEISAGEVSHVTFTGTQAAPWHFLRLQASRP